MPPSLRGALLALAAFGAYACSDVSIKGLGQHMSSLQVLFVAACFTIPLVLGQLLYHDRRASLWPALPGLTAARVAITLTNGALVTYAFTVLPLAQCYAMFFTMPLMITLLAWPILGEPIDRRRGFLVLMGFCGVLVALQPGSTELTLAHLAALGGAMLGALNSIMLRLIGSREKAGVMLLYPVAAQAAVVGLAMPFLWVPMSASSVGLAALMGLLGTAGGFLIIAAYRHARAIVVAPMQYSQILWASTLGILFFDEWPSPVAALGIAIIIAAGLMLLSLSRGAADPAPEPAAQ